MKIILTYSELKPIHYFTHGDLFYIAATIPKAMGGFSLKFWIRQKKYSGASGSHAIPVLS